PLQHIENDALATKQHAGVMADHGDGLSPVKANAVKDLSVADDLGMTDHVRIQVLVDLQDTAYGAGSGEKAVLLGENGGCGALLRIDAGARGGVTGGLVLQQRVFENTGDSSAVPIHKRLVPVLVPLLNENVLPPDDQQQQDQRRGG